MALPSISIVGAGYVGLCTAVGFASNGYAVITSEHDQKKVALIKGIPTPIFKCWFRVWKKLLA